MAQSLEERRQNHVRACQRYRERNLEKMRERARERMRRLRAERKEAVPSTSSAPQKYPTFNFTDEAVAAAVKATLTAWNEDGPNVEMDLQAAHAHMRSLMDNLPPSSDASDSDSTCSDMSDVRILPEVTSSSDEDSGFDTYSENEDAEGSSSDDER
ncbi:hypothetical protein H0H92_011923, partial [Tricholoma furcatifolium]